MEVIALWSAVGYIILITLIALAMFGIDKQRARKKGRRIPEKQLLFISLMGGSIGALSGMYLFHHKTKHPLFYLGIPTILLLEIIFAVYIYHQ